MHFRKALACLGLIGLSACAAPDWNAAQTALEDFDLVATVNETHSAAFQTIPFADGAISIVAEEHGELHTYTLSPCGVGKICGPSGRVGDLVVQDNYYIVTGAYPGRRFFLSPGGDGILTWRGVDRDLAWN